MLNDFIFGMVASFIRKSVKNPVKKRKMRNICLDIYQAIKVAYADDEEFQ
jgi:hypothetical protein